MKRQWFQTLPYQGNLFQYYGMNADQPKDAVLLRFSLSAQRWARERKLDLSIKPLTLSSLNLAESGKFSGYAELDSQIKAARTRVLFEYVAILVETSGPFECK